MNQVNLIGRLAADPELTAPKGNPICRYRLALDRPGTDTGADFVTIISFGTRGENDARWLTKGRLIAVTGRLHHNTWTDQTGQRRERLEIIAAATHYLDGPRPAAAETRPGEEPF
ncbi:MAG: single-stranded DNA-binding protein [Acidimicrobiales bacterium]